MGGATTCDEVQRQLQVAIEKYEEALEGGPLATRKRGSPRASVQGDTRGTLPARNGLEVLWRDIADRGKPVRPGGVEKLLLQ